jgi:hypothetical protein
MGLQQFAGYWIRLLVLRPRARRRTRETLIQEALTAKLNFDAELSGVTELQARTIIKRRKEIACIADIVAHLSVAHAGTAKILNWITSQDPAPFTPDYSTLFAGRQGRTFEKIREEYEQNWKAFVQSAQHARVLYSKRTVHHFMMGDLFAKEWIVLVALHYKYHYRQLRRYRRGFDIRD